MEEMAFRQPGKGELEPARTIALLHVKFTD